MAVENKWQIHEYTHAMQPNSPCRTGCDAVFLAGSIAFMLIDTGRTVYANQGVIKSFKVVCVRLIICNGLTKQLCRPDGSNIAEWNKLIVDKF
jgi:hypothetical protein